MKHSRGGVFPRTVAKMGTSRRLRLTQELHAGFILPRFSHVDYWRSSKFDFRCKDMVVQCLHVLIHPLGIWLGGVCGVEVECPVVVVVALLPQALQVVGSRVGSHPRRQCNMLYFIEC